MSMCKFKIIKCLVLDSKGDLPFSIEAWKKPENATNFTIISKGKYNVDGEYLLQLDANKKLYFALYDGAFMKEHYTILL